MSKAVWFRADKFGPQFELSEMYAMLYRRARLAGYEIKSERSNITRGYSYNAPIYQMVPRGVDADGIHRHHFVPRGAGQGANPMEAIISALRLVRVDDPLTLVTILEAEVWLLARAARNMPAHNPEIGIAALTEEPRSTTVPPAAEPEGPRPIAAKPGEDDDL